MAKSFLFAGTGLGGGGMLTDPTTVPPSLTFAFSRSYSSVTPGGLGVGTNTARYWHHPRLLCGAADVRVELPNPNVFGEFHLVQAGGVALDSVSPMFVYLAADPGRLGIYKGPLPNPALVHQKFLYESNSIGTPRRGQIDLMKGETGFDATVCNDAKSYHVCHGLVLALCEYEVEQTHISATAVSITINQDGTWDIELPSGTPPRAPGSTPLLFIDSAGGGPASVIKFPNTTTIRVSNPGFSIPTAPFPVFIPQWKPRAISMCVWQEGDGASAGWKRVFTDSVVSAQDGKRRSAFFQCQGFRVLKSGDVLEAWFKFSDYVINGGFWGNSTTGRFYVMKVTRASVGQQWTLGPVQKVLELPVGAVGMAGKHAHPPYIERFGETGLRVVCPIGDAYGNNSVIALYRINENYTEGEASNTDGTTLNGWSTRVVHGAKTGNTTSPTGEGNQFVGSAPLGHPGAPAGQLIGTDETPHAIAAVSAPVAGPGPNPIPATTRLNFVKLYGPGAAGINRAAQNRGYVFVVFGIACQDQLVGGPFAAHLAPGTQDGWQTNDEASRILYSPDGTHWGQCFALQYAEPSRVEFVGNRMLFGSSRGTVYRAKTLRSIGLPTITVQQPLLIGAGGTNRISIDVNGPASGTVGLGNSVTNVTAQVQQLAGIGPPCFGQVFRVTSTNASDATSALGVWRLTSATPSEALGQTVKIKTRMWVYPLAWNGTTVTSANSVILQVALGRFFADNTAAQFATGREEFQFYFGEVGDAVRGWFPVTMDTDPQAKSDPMTFRWRNDANTLDGNPSSAFTLGMRLRTRKIDEPPNPCDFLIAFDYVVAGGDEQEHSSIALPHTNTLSGDEQAAVTGLNCGNNWTIEMAGEVPDHCWDLTDVSRPYSTTPKVLCTFYESATKWISVEADPLNNAIRLRFADNTTKSFACDSLAQRFSYLRGSQVLFALRCQLGTNGLATYTLTTSIAGTEPSTGSKVDMPNCKPTEVRFGNKDKLRAEAMLWYGGLVHENEARTTTQMAEALRQLDMLLYKSFPLPPGSGGVA